MDKVTNLAQMVTHIIRDNYSQRSPSMPMLTRYKNISLGFDLIIQYVAQNFGREAEAYYKKRSKHDKRLEEIQSQAYEEIITCVMSSLCNRDIIYKIIPASSFSAKTNLVDEMSDLDFLVLVKSLTDDKAICFSNSFGTCNYILTDIRNREDSGKKHWVFQKYIDNVEIEAKVRDYDGFRELLKMHNYTDNLMPKRDKIYLTYAKYLLKRYDTQAYEYLKMIYYCNAGYHGNVDDRLYALLK